MSSVHMGVDVGGTFTDVVLAVDDRLITAKVPTEREQSAGVIAGIQKACQTAGIDPAAIDTFSHGMTVSTNALLEQNGAKTALITTAGFRDVLEIGRQDRPNLYDLDVDRPTPLVPRRRRYEVDERATVDGIETPVDPAAVRNIAAQIDNDVDSVAVSLLHAYAHPDNERKIAEVLRDELSAHVSLSHEVLAEFREYERTSTTVVDAYVTPAIDRYLERLVDRATELNVPEPTIMQSNGGTASPATVRDRAVTTALSGPAAGVVGAGALADEQSDLITFDMGGTSCDVGVVRDGEAARTTDIEIGGYPIAVPMVDVNTVGAGGGSIAWVDDGGALRVGPQSAGADPGPACYGNGGTKPTVTDANVVLGYIGPDSTLGGELELDANAARAALDDLAASAGLEDATAAARGIYRVVNANMTRAIRTMTVERGHDPREFGLVAFGGAGPLHAAAIADDMDIDRVLVPYGSGVLSAYGLVVAAEKHDTVRTYRRDLETVDPESLTEQFSAMRSELAERIRSPDPRFEQTIDLRYVGQSFELTVPVDEGCNPSNIAEAFQNRYEQTYGYQLDDPIEIVNLRVSAVGDDRSIDTTRPRTDADPHIESRQVMVGDSFTETPVYDRDLLSPGTQLTGPVILEQTESTTVVPAGWSGSVRPDGTLVLDNGEKDD